MAEGEKLAEEWARRIESYHIEDIFRAYEDDEELDGSEEKVS